MQCVFLYFLSKLPFFVQFIAMNINMLNELFPIVPYTNSDDESDVEPMDVANASPSAERGKQLLQ